MALPILSNWLSKKIRYSFMPTTVFRFMIGSNVEQLKFDLSTVVFGSTLPFYRLSLLKRTVQGQLEFKNPSLHVANLMHTLQTLMDYFYPMHTACFDPLDQNGWKSGEISGDMCSSCFKITNCTYISLVVLYI